MSTTVVGVFADRTHAEQAVAELRREGFDDSHISVVSQRHDERAPVAKSVDGHTQAAEGSAAGAAVGAGVGALWALGIAAAAFPPLGVVIGGPLIALIASAGTGATVGTLIGGLVGLGIPEEDAGYYDTEVRGGRTLVTVRSERADAATSILRANGATQRTTSAAATAY